MVLTCCFYELYFPLITCVILKFYLAAAAVVVLVVAVVVATAAFASTSPITALVYPMYNQSPFFFAGEPCNSKRTKQRV